STPTARATRSRPRPATRSRAAALLTPRLRLPAVPAPRWSPAAAGARRSMSGVPAARLDRASPGAVMPASTIPMRRTSPRPAELAKQGRMVLPATLLQAAGIEREVTVVGVHDYLEIWDRARWREHLQEVEGSAGHVAERVANRN